MKKLAPHSGSRRRTAASALFAVLLISSALSAASGPADRVLVRRGTLPIILTAPHGGREAIPGIAPRSNHSNDGAYGRWGGFHRSSDPNTDRLALGIAAEIRKLTGREPYLVVAKFLRTEIDANRPPELAFDDPAARPYYDDYHRSIRRFVDEIRRNYPAGVLIDVHGQVKDPEVIMRGTSNGRTVERLLKRAGAAAVTGPKGIYGQLEAHGFKIFPGNDVALSGHAEDAGFSGGYTVFTYGSHRSTGIDAVQLEFGSRYRRPAVVDQAARDAGRAVAAFYQTYLRSPPGR